MQQYSSHLSHRAVCSAAPTYGSPLLSHGRRADSVLGVDLIARINKVATATGMFFLCDDTPTGKWGDRHQATQTLLHAHVDSPLSSSPPPERADDSNPSAGSDVEKGEKTAGRRTSEVDYGRGSVAVVPEREAHMSKDEMRAVAQGEIVVAPTGKEMMRVIFSLQTAFHCCTYICSFGG